MLAKSQRPKYATTIVVARLNAIETSRPNDDLNAKKLIERRGDKRNDLQFEFDVVGRWAVVCGLRAHEVVLQAREVSRDARRVALTPARMVEDRVVNAVQPQEQAEREDDEQAERPPCRRFERGDRDARVRVFQRGLNVQYLFRKKLMNMPPTFATNQVLCPCPSQGLTAAETINPTASAITDTLRNCAPSRTA